MTVTIDKKEVTEILIEHLEGMFPNMNIIATDKYGDYEFEITKIEEKKAE